jgi:hypothetical protein
VIFFFFFFWDFLAKSSNCYSLFGCEYHDSEHSCDNTDIRRNQRHLLHCANGQI